MPALYASEWRVSRSGRFTRLKEHTFPRNRGWVNEPVKTLGGADNNSGLTVIERPGHNLDTKPTELHRRPPLNV